MIEACLKYFPERFAFIRTITKHRQRVKRKWDLLIL